MPSSETSRVLFFFLRELRNSFLFFFNDPATTEIYTLSLHDALPISRSSPTISCSALKAPSGGRRPIIERYPKVRSEEHTSELQSQSNLVCRLLLEKKKKIINKFDAIGVRNR